MEAGMKLEGVHHVSLDVRDVEEARRFYVEVLGLEEIPRPAFPFPGAWLRSGAQEIHLILRAGHEAPQGQHFAFRVDDVDAAAAALAVRGVAVGGPMDVPGAGRQAFLRDPSGNLIELNQPQA
jgi:catechol 2,3-dioxygenase-like lactoylglutathione lyase family enzyme